MPSPITIIGGGIAGLSIGWRLLQQGHNVTLFEKGQVGSEASSAAAGMITPASEVRFGEHDLLKLFLYSLKHYQQFIEDLEKESGVQVDFQKSGSLMVSVDADDDAELTRLYEYQKSLGLPVSLISPDEIQRLEPLLSAQCTKGIYAPGEFFLDNLLLIKALKTAYLKHGGKLFEECEVNEAEITGDKLTGLKIKNETIKTERVILATGIHSIKGLPHTCSFPIRPVKGQALSIKMPTQKLTHAIRSVHRYPVYLVPRSDGHIVIGATLEEMGQNTDITAGALLDLLYGAWKIFPTISDLPIVKTWVGFRPASRDNAPILGRTPLTNLYTALGFYRHGILLAPAVSQLMSDYVGKDCDSEFFKIFGGDRFKL